MGRYLDVLDVDVTTRTSYEGYIRNHIRPLLGKLPVGKLTGETLDSFYTILRRCRAHCDGRPFVEHIMSGVPRPTRLHGGLVAIAVAGPAPVEAV